MDAVGAQPGGFLGEERVEVDDGKVELAAEGEDGGAVGFEDLREAADGFERGGRVALEVGRGVDRRDGAKHDVGGEGGAARDDLAEVGDVAVDGDVDFGGVEAAVVGAEEHDDEVGLFIEDVGLQAAERAGRSVAADAGIEDFDVEEFGEFGGVAALGDAVAEADDLGRCGGGVGGSGEEKREQ
jgi:hypothetical protein